MKLSKKSCEPGLPAGLSLDGAKVLVVDDTPENLRLVGILLEKQNAEVLLAESGASALGLIGQGFSPDLILLDIMMPEMDGFEVLQVLKGCRETCGTPVILLTALDGTDTQEKGFRCGAVDYITKPINAAILVHRVAVQVELKRARERLERQQESLKEEIARQVAQSRLLENQLQIALESSGFLVWRYDPAAASYSFSTPVTALLGYGWNHIDEARFLALVHPEDRPLAQRIARPGAGGYELGDYRLRHQDGRWIWVEGRSRTLVAASGVTVGVLSDLSGRKEQERILEENLAAQRQLNKRLEEAHNQLLQAEKMASIGQLAAGVAHELNNPIGFVHSNLGTLETYLRDLMEIVSAFASAAEASGDEAPALAAVLRLCRERDLDYIAKDVFELLAESKDGLNRLRKIVLDLKTFSHVGEHEWQEADLHRGLDSTLNIVWNELKYKCRIVKEYGDIPPVYCLGSQLNQVFMNLLVNAGQAIEEQGTITIRTCRQGDAQVRIEIEDTGKGIPPEHLNRVFEPFFTTKPVGKGTGLGLSLSYSIIERHHGTLAVRSEAGKGTCFSITLPIRPGAGDTVQHSGETIA